MKISELAESISGKIYGDKNLNIQNLSKIDEAQNGELTFLYLPAYEKYFNDTKASAIIVKLNFPKTRNDITYIEVNDPDKAFAKIAETYFNYEAELSGIDDSSFIAEDSVIGENTALGKNVVISSGCKIGNNVKIFHNTVLLENVKIGNNCLIYQNVSIRENCIIGNNVIIHPGTVIGSDGFGFNHDENGKYKKVPQIGNVVVEDDVEIGSNVSIDRATIGSTTIKRGVKIDNLVQIAHNVFIDEDTAIASQTGISGSTRIGKNCILAGQAGIAGHINIVDNVIILAQSGVSKSINKPGKYFGYPAKEFMKSLKIEAHLRNLPKYSDRINELEKEIKNLKKLISNSK